MQRQPEPIPEPGPEPRPVPEPKSTMSDGDKPDYSEPCDETKPHPQSLETPGGREQEMV